MEEYNFKILYGMGKNRIVHIWKNTTFVESRESDTIRQNCTRQDS